MKPLALALLVAQLVVTLLLLPESPLAHPSEPVYLASLASIVVTVVLLVTRFVSRPWWLDRQVLAVFLAGMPMIYAWSALWRGHAADLALESVGIAVYGGMALIGFRRAPWLIGAGIIAHGVAWDAWHHGHSAYIPDWYSLGCLIADLGVDVFALVYLRDARHLRDGDAVAHYSY